MPVAESMQGEGQFIAATLPAGTYAMMLHVGHPSELKEASARLLAWALGKNIQ
jgi:effector-binding domain-containing protein